MKRLIAVSLTAAVVTAVSALAGTARALAAGPAPSASAVFVQTNAPEGNRIAVYARAADGSLTPAGTVATGGLGGVQAGAVVDTLASQGGLAYDGDHRLLFAVNAGSDSLSVFGVDGTTLTLNQVVSSGGSFPTSITVHGNLVYVLNAGGAGSVQGFRIEGSHLGPLHDGSRSLGLGNDETPFFLTSPGQVGFSPDGSRLLVTTKGSTSSIDVFAVNANGSLSASPVVNAAATPAPFAFTFAAGGRLVSAEAGANAVTTYTLGGDGTLGDPRTQPDGQAALCWIASAGGYFYVANAASATISGYRVAADGTPSLIGGNGVVGSTEAGAIDLAASPDGRFLYAESGGAGTLDTFAVNPDGSLSKLAVTGGLPVGLEGIAVS